MTSTDWERAHGCVAMLRFQAAASPCSSASPELARRATGLGSVSYNSARPIGPAVGGGLAGTIGPGPCVAFNAVRDLGGSSTASVHGGGCFSVAAAGLTWASWSPSSEYGLRSAARHNPPHGWARSPMVHIFAP